MISWLKRILRLDGADDSVTPLRIFGREPLYLPPSVPNLIEAEVSTAATPQAEAPTGPQSPLQHAPKQIPVLHLVLESPVNETSITPQPVQESLLASPIQLPAPDPSPPHSTFVLRPAVIALDPPSSQPFTLEVQAEQRTIPATTSSNALARLGIASALRDYWSYSSLYPGVSSSFCAPGIRVAARRLGTGSVVARASLVTPPQPSDRKPSNVPVVRPLSRFLSAVPCGVTFASDSVQSLDPTLFSLFLLYEEGSPSLPQAAAESYLTHSQLAHQGRQLRDLVLANFEHGEAPLTPDTLLACARTVTSEVGTSLLLCHNVTRLFARGGRAIAWSNVGRDAGRYYTETSAFQARPRHVQGVLRATAVSPPAMFYLLFSSRSFGTEDTGDWYRHFALATLSAFASASRIVFDPRFYSPEDYPLIRVLDRIATLLANTSDASPRNGGAWVWANAISFAEWGTWGYGQSRADRAAHLATDAVRFGCSAAGVALHDTPPWFIPVAGALEPTEIDASSIAGTLPPEDASPIPPGGAV